MNKNYNYPLNSDWSTEEIIHVIQFFNAVEQAYEKGIPVGDFKKAYRQFKHIVTSISEEKQLGKAFEEMSGYSIYRTVQEFRAKSKSNETGKRSQIITMKNK
ncbi:UPF0223 family protein [Aerococcaceae bacterium WGS1372]